MLELTQPQQDIYLEGKLFGRVLNNIGGYQKYRCSIDIPRFLRAHTLLLQKNDAYHLRFREVAGACSPFVDDGLPPELLMVECISEASALAWVQQQFEIPFDELSDNVFQDALIKISPDEYWYFAKAHHLVMDGWGFALQMQRFLKLYEQLAEPEAEASIESSIYPSFHDYMQRQSGYRDSAAYRHSRDHWMARHAQGSGAMFTPRGGQAASGSQRISGVLGTELIEALQRLASEANANLVTVMYAALYVYFSRSYQRDDITICSPVHNRRTAADKDTIGSVVNVVAHRLGSSPRISFS